MSEKLNRYIFKMALFGNSEPVEFFLFVRNFQMALKASGTLASGAKIQYLPTLVHGEALHQIDTLSTEGRSITSEHLESTILVLGTCFFLLMRCQNKNVRCAAQLGIHAV